MGSLTGNFSKTIVNDEYALLLAKLTIEEQVRGHLSCLYHGQHPYLERRATTLSRSILIDFRESVAGLLKVRVRRVCTAVKTAVSAPVPCVGLVDLQGCP